MINQNFKLKLVIMKLLKGNDRKTFLILSNIFLYELEYPFNTLI